MAIILHIDTALGQAHCALSQNGVLINEQYNEQQQDHAAWLHTAIAGIIKTSGISDRKPAAISVTEGPGSYTGLRVGMAAAKGLCYAWGIPLITVSPLKLLAMAALEAAPGADVIYAMIDARRMEVFAAGYNNMLEKVLTPSALILDATVAAGLINGNAFFCGNGAFKMAQFGVPPERILTGFYTAGHHILSAFKMFAEKKFANVAYTEPLYIKPVHTIQKPNGRP